MTRRLVYTEQAQLSLTSIALGIIAAGGERATAVTYVGRLREKCRSLSALPGQIGRARPELGSDLRSFALGSHVIFFRYAGTLLEVIDVVEGRRDLHRYFSTE